MDPDPYVPRFLDRKPFSEWESMSSITNIPEQDAYNGTSQQRSPSPPKRPRNTKNLSLNVPPGTSKNNSVSTSAPTSPFRSPRHPRRPGYMQSQI
jgi:hypothetical protein